MLGPTATSPHFVGLWVAGAGIIATLAWWRRVGPPAWKVALTVPFWLAVALFGSGNAGVRDSTTLPGVEAEKPILDSKAPPLTAEQVWLAYNTAIAPEFLEYLGSLDDRWARISHPRLRSALKITRGADPQADWSWVVNYVDYDNWGAGLLDSRLSRLRLKRHDFFQQLERFVSELLFVECYRAATTEGQKISCLRALRAEPRLLAEWLARDAYYFTLASPSKKLLTEIRRTQRALRAWIDDPELRGLPPETRGRLQVPRNHDGSAGNEQLERLWTRKAPSTADEEAP